MNDEFYMNVALELAKKGMGYVSPNPMVGAVIVKDGEIIGKGYHEKYGCLHAERNAIANCVKSPEGGTIYVTLEPCCHYGKTPPCTEAIIEAGIEKVVVGAMDDNKLVSGKGVKILREHGIEVVTGVLEKECRELNKIFFHYITNKTPYVCMKYAMTADGKIATVSGKSRWISCEKSRKKTHFLRHRYSAIMVGVNTVISDNPMLTARTENGISPIRIICDTHLRTPTESDLVSTAKEVPTIIATCSDNTAEYEKFGVKIIKTAQKDGHVDLKDLMRKLGEENIDSVILEGGSNLNFSALKSGVVNELQVYVAPKIFGGERAKSPVGGAGIDEVSDAVKLKMKNMSLVGDDVLIEYEVM